MAKSLNPSTAKIVTHEWIIESQEVKGDDGFIHTFFRSSEFPHRTRKKNQWVSTLEMVSKVAGKGQFSYMFLLKTKCGNRPTLKSALYKASIVARNTHDNSLQREIVSFEKEKDNSGNAVTFQVDFDAKNILSYFDDTKDSPDLLIKIVIHEVKKRPEKIPVITRKRSANSTSLNTNGTLSSRPASASLDEPEIEQTRVKRPDEITSTVNEIQSGSSKSNILRRPATTSMQKPEKPTLHRSKYFWSSDDDFHDDFNISRKVMNKHSPQKRAKASTHEDVALSQSNESSSHGVRLDKNTSTTEKDESIPGSSCRNITAFNHEKTSPVMLLTHNERRPTPTNSRVVSTTYQGSVSNATSSKGQLKNPNLPKKRLSRVRVKQVQHRERSPTKVQSHVLGRSAANYNVSVDDDFKESRLGRGNKPKADSDHRSKNYPRPKRENTSRKIDLLGSSSDEDEVIIPKSQNDQAFRSSQYQLSSGSTTRSWPSKTSSDEASAHDSSFSRVESKNYDIQTANTGYSTTDDDELPDIHSYNSTNNRPTTYILSRRTGNDDHIKQDQLNPTQRFISPVSTDDLPQNSTVKRSSHNEGDTEDQHLVIRKPIDKFFQCQRS